MNKTQLVAALAEEQEVSKQEAATWLEAFETIVTQAVTDGDPVMISGFVKFAKVDRAARNGRNPATGEAIKIPAKSSVKATALKKFKDAVMAGSTKRKKR